MKTYPRQFYQATIRFLSKTLTRCCNTNFRIILTSITTQEQVKSTIWGRVLNNLAIVLQLLLQPTQPRLLLEEQVHPLLGAWARPNLTLISNTEVTLRWWQERLLLLLPTGRLPIRALLRKISPSQLTDPLDPSGVSLDRHTPPIEVSSRLSTKSPMVLMDTTLETSWTIITRKWVMSSMTWLLELLRLPITSLAIMVSSLELILTLSPWSTVLALMIEILL